MEKVTDDIKAERESKLGLSNETKEASEAQATSVSFQEASLAPALDVPFCTGTGQR